MRAPPGRSLLPFAHLLLAALLGGCGEGAPILLRHESLDGLTVPKARERLGELGLFDAHLNPDGLGPGPRYVLQGDGPGGKAVVKDEATGLFWQRAGSPGRLTFEEAHGYVSELRQTALGGFSDWRLPTLEEALSLNRPERGEHGLHLDPVFGDGAWWVWTADRESLVAIWVVDFASGSAFTHVPIGGSAHVKAVRAE